MGPIFWCTTVFIICTILLGIYVWLSEFFHYRQTLGFIPGPKTYPFIGLSWQIKGIPYGDRFKWFNDLCLKFEKGMVVTWFGIEPLVNIRKPRQIEVILPNNRFLRKSRIYKVMLPWLEKGLLTSTDDMWYIHKRHIVPVFGATEEFTAVMHEKVGILSERIRANVAANRRSPINVFDPIVKYTLDVIWKTATGVDMDVQRMPHNAFVKALDNFARISTDRYYRYWIKLDFVYYRTQDGKEFLEAIRTMDNYIENVIKQTQVERKNRKSIEEKSDGCGNNKRKAFLDLLLDVSEKSQNQLTVEEIQQEMKTFMFAGHGPISTAISWALFALGNAPEVQARVHHELREIFHDDSEQVTTEKLDELKYLDRVIKEVLRLYPSIPTIGRSLDNDAVIDYCFIPKGSTVNIQIYQLHHDPEIWEDPQIFDPDRFLPENSNGRHPYAYMPFSIGSRNCIGQKFAFLQMKIALTAILRKWRVSSVLRPNEMQMISNFILRPYKNKVEMYFMPINNIL